MARWRELGRRIAALDEIGEMLGAIRSLAFIEVRRLGDGAGRRHDSLAAIESALADLAMHHPEAVPDHRPAQDIVIAIGSERGFCGDFNDAVGQSLANLDIHGAPLAIGTRLGQSLGERDQAHRPLDGAAVSEDVPRVLGALTTALERVTHEAGGMPSGLIVLHHDDDGALRRRRILPVPESTATLPHSAHLDLLLAPRELYAALIDHYVMTSLEVSLLASLLAENRRRVEHMEAAIDRLHERLDALSRQRHRARQEAITEEIEIILLGNEPTTPA